MSTRENYCSGNCFQLHNVTFIFEQNDVWGLVPKKCDSRLYKCGLRAWYRSGNDESVSKSVQREIEAVQKYYLPFWRQQKGRVVVLSHDVLLYYRGILETIPNDQLLFVRIRRARYEAARSWEKAFRVTHICNQDWFAFCPYELETSVVLKPPSLQNWLSLNVFQRALWYIDEVEARWQRLKSAYSKVVTFEVGWEKSTEGSLENAIEQLNNIILGSCGKRPKPKNIKQHVEPLRNHAEFQKILKLLDLKYQEVMNYSLEER